MASTSSVLARKYRSQTFADLIGQDALVRTLTNAIENNKLASAYILTGIRGVGKTSSARIIAKGLNCIGPDGQGKMTPNPCGVCKHCQQIANDAHMDVIEIDAASNTGVDNAREIIESAKYNPVSARFKIFIIDEVHMLSKAAFNALLKTLEEPPERIKFIFATTEIHKVPITILSRCQRFDLRRVDVPTLTAHLKNIVAKENATADDEALKMIAKMGEGSVRDSLSLLDQALVRFEGNLTADNVAQMVGLADKGVLFDLYEAIMAGQMQRIFEILSQQDALGFDPLSLATDMLDLTHWLTRVKITPTVVEEVTLSKADTERGKLLADSLSIAALTAVWQMLLKGLQELKMADNPTKAFEMLLVRLVYRAQLPDLTKLSVEQNEKKKQLTLEIVPESSFEETSAQPETTQLPDTLEKIVVLAREHDERILAFNLENYVQVIELNPPHLTCALTPKAPARLVTDLVTFLTNTTGQKWIVEQQETAVSQTIKEKKEEKKQTQIAQMQTDPVIAQILKAFPDAKITSIKNILPDLSETEEKNENFS